MEDTPAGERGLMSALLLQAMKDLGSGNFEIAYAAYQWLMEDGPFYMEAVGLTADIQPWVVRIWQLRQLCGPKEARGELRNLFAVAKAVMNEVAT